ncbi:ATP-grasp domain-containing protein [Agrilutibacter solisilvae]|uniref:ATP-grasp domain-containing protein n=1 Tax=Agrilutibacter solisilvae TaxID=2763317 RepID=A0A975ATT5_9GAMM|nr:hypothetical protein [Lysobacter solisilvae]QSX79658.1 hypothetical protein I8J32_007390 [Lysobacter solisilvae]
MRLALATAIDHVRRDADLAPLLDACAAAGIDVVARAWDDASVDWARFDVVLVRSTWDYTRRLPEFLRWCRRVDAVARLLNPLDVLAWNTDKHYLRDLAARGVPVVPTRFVEPDEEPLPALQAFLGDHGLEAGVDAAQFVIKPAVGAGSRDAQRYTAAQEFAASNHLARLLESGRSAMLQPFLPSVERDGETGLLYFGGEFSHAIGKGLRLPAHDAGEFEPEAVTARVPADDERALAQQVLVAAAEQLRLKEPLLYARVDVVRDDAGAPCLLELELCEPSLFFDQAPGSVERFAGRLVALGR